MEKDIVLVLVGFVVGVMNAIAGGGMLVGFPVLVSLGLPALTANATANVVTLPGQLASAFGYRSYLRKVPVRYAALLVPIIIGALSGAYVLRQTSAEHFAHFVPVLVLFGVGLFTFQPLIHFHLHSHLTGRARTMLPLVLIGLALLPLSFYGGYFGAGFGFILLAFLGLTSLHDTHMMNSMKNVAASCVAIASLLVLYGSGLMNWRYGIIMAIGSTIGGYVGARGAQKVSSHWLRVCIIIIGLTAAVCLGLREY